MKTHGYVTRLAGRRDFSDEGLQLVGREARPVFVLVRFDQLVGRHVVVGETGERRVAVQPTEMTVAAQ